MPSSDKVSRSISERILVFSSFFGTQPSFSPRKNSTLMSFNLVRSISVTLLGIYFCIGLAKILGKNPYTEKFFSLVGKESFHIMALHFLGFKIVDRIYSSVYGITDAEKIGKFPHSDYGLHISYVIAGVLIPLCMITLLRKVQKYGHFVKEM